jgi:hypothetical protein
MSAASSQSAVRRRAASGRPSGTWIVAGMIALAMVLAAFAVWFQWGQTRRCLAFYGSEAAHRIQLAPRVELWRIGGDGAARPPTPGDRTDVSGARGLVHLRRGLVEDANFSWDDPDRAAGDPAAEPWALAFFDDVAGLEPGTVVIIRLDAAGGSLAVAGRPGILTLGRLAAGLRTWLADVARPEAFGGGGG